MIDSHALENMSRQQFEDYWWSTPGFACGAWCDGIFYGREEWPSHSFWIVPGTVTDVDRAFF